METKSMQNSVSSLGVDGVIESMERYTVALSTITLELAEVTLGLKNLLYLMRNYDNFRNSS